MNIKALRKKLKLTQRELAIILNCDTRTISRWENGDFEPSPAMLYKLRELLNNKS